MLSIRLNHRGGVCTAAYIVGWYAYTIPMFRAQFNLNPFIIHLIGALVALTKWEQSPEHNNIRCISKATGSIIGCSVPTCQLGNKEWTNRANRIIWLSLFLSFVSYVCVRVCHLNSIFRNAYTLRCRWCVYTVSDFNVTEFHSNLYSSALVQFAMEICIKYNFYRVEWVFSEENTDWCSVNIENVV